MATIEVNGGTIAYEIFGEGQPLVWNSGGRMARSARDYLIAGYFAQRHSVLLWDRMNSEGASDVRLSEAPSPTHADAEDLHAILETLDLGPAIVGGASAGCALSLHMAHRYREDVSAILAIHPGSRDQSVRAQLSEGWYPLADAAESGGMQAAIDLSLNAYRKTIVREADRTLRRSAWLARSIEASPTNRERTLGLAPGRFATMARRWGDTVQVGDGLSDHEIQSIEVPALVISGSDALHPPDSATWLAGCLHAADAPIIEPPLSSASFPEQMAAHFPVIDAFLREAV